MGNRKKIENEKNTFIPKISSASRKLALRRLASLDTGGVPHFMLNTKGQTREPLAPIPTSQPSSLNESGIVPFSANDLSIKQRAPLQKEKIFKDKLDLKSNPESFTFRSDNMSGKSDVILDDNIFTFKPKVSSASAKIVENLGTDFMARQQQHLERQRRNFEQANSIPVTYTSGRLSPVNKTMRKSKKNKENEESDILNSNSETSLENDTEKVKEEDTEGDNMPFMLNRTKTTVSPNLQRILNGPYAAGNPDMVLKRHRNKLTQHQVKAKQLGGDSLDDTADLDTEVSGSFSRSKTMPSLSRPKLSKKLVHADGNAERLRHAKEVTERAIKNRKVFTIQGGYSTVRHSLRRRGWVEKFYKLPSPPKKTPRKKQKKFGEDADDDDDDDDDDDGNDDDDDDDGNDDDDDDSDNDQPKIPPWEEEDGIYGIMSRMVRNVNPTFIWVLKRDIIDYRFLTKEQMVNHYCKAGSFTTKVGLCVNMRNVPWFDESNPDSFYPRCYRLSHEEEKAAFIDDYRETACINILKIISSQYSSGTGIEEVNNNDDEEEARDPPETPKSADPKEESTESSTVCSNPECTRSRPGTDAENVCAHVQPQQSVEKPKTPAVPRIPPQPPLPKIQSKNSNKKKKVTVPIQCLERAIVQCEYILIEEEHNDIDLSSTAKYELTQQQWDEQLKWYYQLAHDDGFIPNVSQSMLTEVDQLLNRIKAKKPQYELDGTKNVWIVKPGAKSRGRGIVCYNKLEDMTKLVCSQVIRKDNKYVVQKYMERPLLIYNTKFDIRQWFLVTDWNPLTIWFYQDSYLRFCSQQYTLDNFDESIHLSNNAIQKHYKNGPRSSKLPTENMWTHEQFKDYIKSRKHGNVWDELIYPGMKKAIICALLCTQDIIEYRKSSFELYGADFMLTEDYQPWLIEINSSPSMESSTAITSRLCGNVMEDTIKVVIDRKFDRNCDVGRFELAYKQPLVTVPPYIGISLLAEGQAIRKPNFMRRVSENGAEPASTITNSTPRRQPSNAVTFSKRPQSESFDSNGNKHPTTNSAPVKLGKSTTENRVQTKVQSHQPQQQNKAVISNTEKSGSSSHPEKSSSYTTRSSSHSDVSSVKVKEQNIPPSPPVPKPEKSNTIPTATIISYATTRMVSNTSCSTNYSIPQFGESKPNLTVNNVESTDLKTIKPALASSLMASKGLNPFIDGTWAKTCTQCGGGMNLRLENTDPNCKCRQDSVYFPPAQSTPGSVRGFHPNRPRSSYSPRPTSGTTVGNRNSATNLAITTTTRNDKTLLRYTDGGIQRPRSPTYVGGNPLPKIVRRYIGRRTMPCHELGSGYPSSSSMYIDTSQIHNPLSIISHSIGNR